MGWYNTSWQNRKQFVTDHTKVSGTATLTGFPVLLSKTDLQFITAKSNGDDFLVTTSDGTTKIPHEIESWNSITGELIIHFKGDVLHDADTYFYLYWNNPAATNQQDAQNVWDSNYKMVLHLKETPAGADSIKDSTINANHFTPTGTIQATGQISNALDFDGIDDEGDANSSDVDGTTNATFSLWFKTAVQQSNQYLISLPEGIGPDVVGCVLQFKDADELKFVTVTGSGRVDVDHVFAYDDDVFHHMVGTYDGTTMRLYIDGVQVNTGGQTGTLSTALDKLSLGAFSVDGFGGHGDAIIDEVRRSDIVRSADWILTEYNNQNSPSTFMRFGTVETVPAITPSWFNVSWINRKKITVDESMIPGTQDFNDFQVLVSVTDTDLQAALANGFDFVVTADDGTTQLKHQIQKWNDATGELLLWVKCPTLFAAGDTELYLYYNNPASSNQSDPENVWPSDDYAAVYHLQDDFLDSTSHNNDGINTESADVAGLIGDGQSFDGVNDIVNVPDDPSLKFAAKNRITVTACWNRNANSSSKKVVSKGKLSAHFGPFEIRGDNPSNRMEGSLAFDGAERLMGGITVLNTGTWYIGHLTYDGATVKWFVDEILESSLAETDTIQDSTIGLAIGGHPNFGQHLNGSVDEVRVQTRAIPDDWARAEVRNWKTPGTYVTFGAEEAGLVSISKTITFKHSILSSVSKSTTFKHNILSAISQAITLKHHVLQLVSSTYTLKHNVEAAVLGPTKPVSVFDIGDVVLRSD